MYYGGLGTLIAHPLLRSGRGQCRATFCLFATGLRLCFRDLYFRRNARNAYSHRSNHCDWRRSIHLVERAAKVLIRVILEKTEQAGLFDRGARDKQASFL